MLWPCLGTVPTSRGNMRTEQHRPLTRPENADTTLNLFEVYGDGDLKVVSKVFLVSLCCRKPCPDGFGENLREQN